MKLDNIGLPAQEALCLSTCRTPTANERNDLLWNLKQPKEKEPSYV